MSNQKIVTEVALSALASDIKNALSGKADSNDVYSKTEIDNALELKADKSDTYTKSEVDTLIDNLPDYYNKDEIDAFLEDKADVDGTYDDMTVGNAKQLKSNVGKNDKVPYNFRISGGSIDIGDRETDMLVGGTVAWNQVVNKDKFISKTSSDYTVTSNDDGSLSVVIINTLASATTVYLTANIGSSYFEVPVTHKYALIDNNALPNNAFYRNGVDGLAIGANTLRTQNRSDGNILLGLSLPSGLAAQTFKISPMIFDLTQMFGSTIADYIYNLEQANTGAGVAYFRSLFPKPYYAYNAGELMSVKTSAHVMTGFNQWDEEWEVGAYNSTNGQKVTTSDRIRSKNHIRVVPNTAYYFKAPNGLQVYGYDADKSYIGRLDSSIKDTAIITPTNVHYITFNCAANSGTTYNNDICINLSWDGERNGEYEPYEEYTYALDSNLELRGIPKLDANNKLYYDGDEYTSDGNVNRRYGIVDLGTLDYTVGSNNRFIANVNNSYSSPDNNTLPRAIISNSKYEPATGNTYVNVNYSFYIQTNGTLSIRNVDYSDKDTFKVAMNGVYLVYELATPTTETADTFTNPQIVNDFGTEEYVDTRAVPIPVGHDTFYQANLRAKLEMAPDSPSGNGDYIIRQNNGQNEYVAFTKELPALPTTNGTYTLKCTVSSGTATLNWVADS